MNAGWKKRIIAILLLHFGLTFIVCCHKNKGSDMHELPIVKNILQVVLKHAVAHEVKKVLAIHIRVGEMSDLEDKWIQKYFDYLAKDNVVKGARLVIERVPVVMKCSDCFMSYEVDLKKDEAMACPECGSVNGTMVSGREYFIKNLEAI